MVSLQELRDQIDDIDQSIIQNLFQGGAEEDYLDEVVELTDEDKQKLRSTRLYFSEKICGLLSQRMQISRQIGEMKQAEGRVEMVDEERKNIMIQSRVAWSSDGIKSQAETFYRIVHDISVRIQNEGKNLL